MDEPVNVAMEWAVNVASRSRCKRLHVGAALLSPSGKVVAAHANVNPASIPCKCSIRGEQCDNTRHAEVGVIMDFYVTALINGWKLPDGKMTGFHVVVTHAPCRQCAILVGTAGVSRVTFGDKYGSDRGTEYLKSIGVEVRQYIP
jgi:deoxycytidylate deaminase